MAGRPLLERDESTFVGKIAAGIRRRRLKKFSSAEEAASAAGVPAPTWYHWEQGRSLPLDRLPLIAQVLDCKPRALLPE